MIIRQQCRIYFACIDIIFLYNVPEKRRNGMKRCLTIQDYSCMGRCSLTVALPILSCSGVETIGLPTAVLSNHTAFSSWTYQDLSDKMLESVSKWKDYNHHFDCIYTGYLGNGQAEIVKTIFEELKEKDTMIVVDPAFGDNGRLYAGFDGKHVDEIRGLLKYADVICPNVTEACELLKIPYVGENVSELEAQRLTLALSQYGPRKIVVTGIFANDGNVGCAIFNRDNSKLTYYYTEPLPGRYHGAGDTFASVMVGSLLNGLSLENAVRLAHDFVHRSMMENIKNDIDGILYGLVYEGQLKTLYQNIVKMKRKQVE